MFLVVDILLKQQFNHDRVDLLAKHLGLVWFVKMINLAKSPVRGLAGLDLWCQFHQFTLETLAYAYGGLERLLN